MATKIVIGFEVRGDDQASDMLKKLSESSKKFEAAQKGNREEATKSTGAFASIKGSITAAASTSAMWSEKLLGISAGYYLVTQAIGAVTSAVQGLLSPQIESEVQFEKLANSMKVFGGYTKDSFGDLEAWAISIGRASGVQDELIASNLASAKAFGLSNESTKAAAEAALGFSQAMGVDFDTAMRQILQTLDGTAGRLNQAVAGMNELSPAALKAGGAIDLLRNKFAPFIGADANTASGSLKRIAQAFGDARDEIATFVLEGIAAGSVSRNLQNVFDGLRGYITQNAEVFRTLGATLADVAVGGIVLLVDGMKKIISIGSGIKGVYDSLNFKALAIDLGLVATAVALLNTRMIFATTVTLAKISADYIYVGALGLQTMGLKAVAVAAWAALLPMIKTVAIVALVAAGVAAAYLAFKNFGLVIDIVKSGWNYFVEGLQYGAYLIQKSVANILAMTGQTKASENAMKSANNGLKSYNETVAKHAVLNQKISDTKFDFGAIGEGWKSITGAASAYNAAASGSTDGPALPAPAKVASGVERGPSFSFDELKSRRDAVRAIEEQIADIRQKYADVSTVTMRKALDAATAKEKEFADKGLAITAETEKLKAAIRNGFVRDVTENYRKLSASQADNDAQTYDLLVKQARQAYLEVARVQGQSQGTGLQRAHEFEINLMKERTKESQKAVETIAATNEQGFAILAQAYARDITAFRDSVTAKKATEEQFAQFQTERMKAYEKAAQEQRDAGNRLVQDLVQGNAGGYSQIQYQYLKDVADFQKAALEKGVSAMQQAQGLLAIEARSNLQKETLMRDSLAKIEAAQGNTTGAILAQYAIEVAGYKDMLDKKLITESQFQKAKEQAQRTSAQAQSQTSGSANTDRQLATASALVSSAQSGLNSIIGTVGQMFGPIGTLIGGVLQMLNMSGAQFKQMIQSLLKAALDLPKHVSENIPILVSELVKSIPAALFQGLFDGIQMIPVLIMDIIGAIAEAIGGVFKKVLSSEFWVGLFKKAIGAIVGAWKNLWSILTGKGRTKELVTPEQVDKREATSFGSNTGGADTFKVKDVSLVGKEKQAKSFEDSFKETVDESSGDFINAIKQAFDWVGEKFKQFGAWIWEGFTKVGDWFAEAGKAMWEGFKAVGTWFADAGIAIWDAFKDVGDWFGDSGRSIWNAFKDIGDWFGRNGKAMWDTFASNAGNFFKVWGQVIWDGFLVPIGNWFADRGRAIWNGLVAGVNQLGDWFGDRGRAIWNGLSGAMSQAATWFKGVGGWIYTGLVDGIYAAWAWIKGVGKWIWNGLSEGLNDAWNWMYNLGKRLWSGFKDSVTNIWNTVTGGSGGGNWVSKGWDTVKSWFAEGGYVPGQAVAAGNSYSNDTVRAMLSPGEFVLPRSVTQDKSFMALVESRMQGRDGLLEWLQGKGEDSGLKFAEGGMASGIASTSFSPITNVSRSSSNNQSNVTVNVNIVGGTTYDREQVRRELIPVLQQEFLSLSQKGQRVLDPRGVYK